MNRDSQSKSNTKLIKSKKRSNIANNNNNNEWFKHTGVEILSIFTQIYEKLQSNLNLQSNLR